MFRQKEERIDFSYLTWHNLNRIYKNYGGGNSSIQRRDTVSSSVSSRDSTVDQDMDFQRKSQKKIALAEQYRGLFVCMTEIIEVLSEQIFEKLSTIPYAIRQFCKNLYQQCKVKFPSADPQSLQRTVGYFLLEKWMLKSAFVTLNTQGLIKEFILPYNSI